MRTTNWNKTIEEYKDLLQQLLEAPVYNFKGVSKKDLPGRSGVYAIFGINGVLLYVGQSSRLRGRLVEDHLQNDKQGSAFRRNLSERMGFVEEKQITQYIFNNCSFRFLELVSPKYFEYFTIAMLKPELNR